MSECEVRIPWDINQDFKPTTRVLMKDISPFYIKGSVVKCIKMPNNLICVNPDWPIFLPDTQEYTKEINLDPEYAQ